MSENQKLLQIIVNLESKLKKVEARLNTISEDPNQPLMDELYKKSRNVVIRYQKASPIFLQKKLLIDFPRANQLINRLEKAGVISSTKSDNTRDILIKI